MSKGNLFEDACAIIDAGRSCAYRDLNAVVNQGYYELGRRIAEEEQGGSTEAGCDKDLLVRLSRNLTKDFGGPGLGRVRWGSPATSTAAPR